MRRIYLLPATVLALGLLSGLYWQHHVETTRPDAVTGHGMHKARTAPVVPEAQAAVFPDALQQQWQQQLEQQAPLTAVPEQTEIWFIQHANRLIQSADHITGQQQQRQLLGELLRSPGQLALAQRLLSDLSYASATYGKEQAMARVVAIKLLQEAARQGDVAPLEQTVWQLSRQLNQQLSQGQSFVKGQQQDLADLLNYRVRLQPRGSTATELSAMLQQLGYQPEQQSQIRDIYGDVLFFALKQQYGREKATVLTAQALQEEVPAG